MPDRRDDKTVDEVKESSDMKNNKTINRIAIKTGTADGDLLKTLLLEETKLKQIPVEPGMAVYRKDDGTIIEFYGAGAFHPDYLFKYTNVVFGFRVRDLKKTSVMMQKHGAKLLGSIETVCNAFIYCHLLLNNTTVVGLYEYIMPAKKTY